MTRFSHHLKRDSAPPSFAVLRRRGFAKNGQDMGSIDNSESVLNRLASYAYTKPATRTATRVNQALQPKREDDEEEQRLQGSPTDTKGTVTPREPNLDDIPSPGGNSSLHTPLKSENGTPDGTSSPATTVPGQDSDEPRARLKRSLPSEDKKSRESSRSRGSSPKKPKRGYADPSVYAHLRPVNDNLKPDLDIIFCGIKYPRHLATISPGQQIISGVVFMSPPHSTHQIRSSGLTSTRMKPQEDFTLPDRHSIGLTNLVGRPTAEASELSKAESLACVAPFFVKMHKYRPKIVCFVGLSIAETVSSYVAKNFLDPGLQKKGKAKVKAGPGLLSFKLTYESEGDKSRSETLFYAVSSTSGRVVKYKKSDKVQQFKGLNDLLLELKESRFDSTGLHSVPASRFTTV
ncbi:hypothetical protein CC1G_09247 [Coprinopsis cinerea okayama7|uniref:Uracil-DNA glycosylase-like domain-containing protein n=1 Tax=Coprinopsis cinerea (strain Okayama-7 / 130 / ATCC MYA-4618 / FGSC 9003) TaxID=240176 RepID=A8P541_COPC7|nr:hypothetical protein CC1G_09247 [Coprinopsis cinerea okayama7\|eukprot:XP_001838870.2 hypothetical protein CC1G_09247 [Coprinopsis cinerea okayama7\